VPPARFELALYGLSIRRLYLMLAYGGRLARRPIDQLVSTYPAGRPAVCVPERIRTSYLRFRKPLLCPHELRGHSSDPLGRQGGTQGRLGRMTSKRVVGAHGGVRTLTLRLRRPVSVRSDCVGKGRLTEKIRSGIASRDLEAPVFSTFRPASTRGFEPPHTRFVAGSSSVERAWISAGVFVR
jgi:hypothetical protein